MVEIEMPFDLQNKTICKQSEVPNLDTPIEPLFNDVTGRGNSTHQNETLTYAFKVLMKKYKKQMGDTNVSIVSGGLQQYLNRKALEQKEPEPDQSSMYHCLPVNVKLHIFSYLSYKELVIVSAVCQDWYNISQDNWLWNGLLERDVVTWPVISHCTNPAVYKETQSEWSTKEIYLKCCPEVNSIMHQQYAMVTSITNILRYIFPKKVPRIAMFGPGLESENTSCIVRNMLYEQSTLQRTGLIPGQFEGVGSGWGLKMEDGTAFTLSVLYTASKQVRQQQGRDRLKGNNLVQLAKDADGQDITELKPAVKDYCRTVDAFVYVIDATKEADSVAEGNQEFFAMVNERWSATHVPVLVLSCVKDSSKSYIPCISVTEKLQMSTMNRPWQVKYCEAGTLSGLLEGFKWLVEQSQRR